MQGNEPTTIPFSTEAMKANLLRLQTEWEKFQSTHDRNAVYAYLNSVYELVEWWAEEGREIEYAGWALGLQRNPMDMKIEPFGVVIFCTSDRDKVDSKMRSKFSRVLRYAEEFKRIDETLRDFIKRKGGINKCASRYARRLGRGSRGQAAACALQQGGPFLLRQER
jgi:hypothetical protein